MNWQKKWEPTRYAFYDFRGLETRFTAMAERGWMVESVSAWGIRYRRTEPRRGRFAVTYVPEASEFDARPTEGQEVLADYCAQAGWQPVLRWGQMQVFFNPDPESVPLETDPVAQVENIHRAMRRNFLPAQVSMALLGLVELGFLGWMLWNDPVGTLASTGFLLLGCWLPVALMAAASLVFYFWWLPRAKRAAAEGAPLPGMTLRGVNEALLVLEAVMVLLWAVCATAQSRLFLLGGAAVAAGVFALTAGAKRGLKRLQAPRWAVRGGTAAASLLAYVVLLAAVVALVLTQGGLLGTHAPVEEYTAYGMTWEAYADPIPLRVGDLLGQETPEAYSTEARVQSSPLVRETEYRQDRRLDWEEDLPELTYTVVEVHFSFLYDLCKTAMLKKWDRYQPDDLPEEYREHHRLQPEAPDGTDALYRRYTGDTPDNYFLFCWENRLAEVHFYWDPTPEQLAAAADRLAPK